MQFLAKISNSFRGVFRTELNIKDGVFWEKVFKLPTISAVYYLHKKLHLRSSTPFWIHLWILTIFGNGFILMLDWVLDTHLTCLKKGKNCEKPVKELFLETLQLRLGNNSKEISEKNYTEKWFFWHLFSTNFVRNSEAATRGAL